MKINAKKTGKYRSKLESTVRRTIPKKCKVEYETRAINYMCPSTYIPDFILTLPNGHTIYVEVKGWFRPEDRRKMDNVIKCNPDLDIRMVFGRKSKSDFRWCEKRNVPYAVAEVPKEWLVT